jgi:hypothetical protein
MVYTTSPSHVSSPRPTYRGCAGDILTPYLHVPHSTLSSSSSSDSDVTSLAAIPCPWAARGRLAWGLGVFLIHLHPFLSILVEARSLSNDTPSAYGRLLFVPFFLNSSCSLRTPHFRHSLHHRPTVPDSTTLHHLVLVSPELAKCTSGMKKILAPAALVNATLSHDLAWKPSQVSRSTRDADNVFCIVFTSAVPWSL